MLSDGLKFWRRLKMNALVAYGAMMVLFPPRARSQYRATMFLGFWVALALALAPWHHKFRWEEPQPYPDNLEELV